MGIWRDLNGALHDDMGGAALTLPSWPKGMVQLSAAEAAAQAPTAQQLHQQLLMQAQNALARTDLVALRCIKAGVVFPAAWLSYTTALRNIANGTDTTSTTIPAQPAYPAGT